MKILQILYLTSILLLSSLAQVQNTTEVEKVQFVIGGKKIIQKIFYFTQVLDHFSANNQRTWQQRYSVYDTHYNPVNGTILVYIGSEGTQKGVYSGWVIQTAKKLQAMAIAIEHRFYGASQPFNKDNNTFTVENLRYLTVDQALEDVAQIISTLKSQQLHGITDRNPFITIGGSYSGAMSAWFRAKYPHLTIGALASSAVIHAVNNFEDFDHQIYLSTARSGEWCPENIQNFNNRIEQGLMQNTTESIEIKSLFNATQLTDIEYLKFMSDIYGYMIQYGKREKLCKIFAQNTTFSEQLGNLLEFSANSYGSYWYSAQLLTNTTYQEQYSMRQWSWQICTEFGWFAVANQKQPMRSKIVDINHFKDFCKTAFGQNHTTPDVFAINARFGGLSLEATNIVFTNGSEDQWQWASLRNSTDQFESLFSECETCGHCIEFNTPSNNDSPSLKQTRARVEFLFSQWIAAHFKQINSPKRLLRKCD